MYMIRLRERGCGSNTSKCTSSSTCCVQRLLVGITNTYLLRTSIILQQYQPKMKCFDFFTRKIDYCSRPGPRYFLWAFVNYISKFGAIFFSAKNVNLFSLIVSFFRMFHKTCIQRGRKQHRAPLIIDGEWTGPRGRHLWHFLPGEITLWTGDRQLCIAKQQSSWQHWWKLVSFAFFTSARYMPISGAASLYFSCCCPFWAVFFTLNFLFVWTVWAFLSYYNINNS